MDLKKKCRIFTIRKKIEKMTLQKEQTYKLGRNTIKVLEIDGDRLSVLVNGTIYNNWSKTEMEYDIEQGHYELI